MDRRIVCAVAGLALLSGVVCPPTVRAQDLGSLLKNLAGQAAQKAVENKVDHTVNPAAQPDHDASPMLRINGAYNFTPGPVTLFQQDFASTPVGSMPSNVKTNGSGTVVTLGSLPGHWLELSDASIYKLAHVANLPHHFTVQFDVIPVAHKMGDLDGYGFGFSPDNSLRDCECKAGDGGGTNQIYISFSGYIVIFSKATGYRNQNNNYSFVGDENSVIHMAIEVDGDQMQVWMNHKKIADSRLFEHSSSRYFYFGTGSSSTHGAKLLLGNLHVGGFNAMDAKAGMPIINSRPPEPDHG